jgi:methanogenic corrinoid protein MtbC1
MSMPSQLPAARATVQQMHAEFGARCPTVWVGGQATLASARVWHSVGADGWAADAMHALEQAT